VIHTVGPVWRGGGHGEADLLAGCYGNSLALALAHGLKTIAFPAISCGAYGYPLEQAAEIAVGTSIAYLRAHPGLDSVYFVLFEPNSHAVYEKVLARLAT
jgi:O-acetyl-ADP-ribose deacetylase (regulator of RNase III)